MALLWSALAVACFLGAGRELWTPDEPREAEISREMYLHPGMVPTLNGEPFYEKPPLYYWTVAAAFALTGGPSPAAARSVSGLASLLTLIALFFWAKRAHSTSVGVAAALMLATSGVFFISTHWVRLDLVLTLFTTIAFWATWELVSRGGTAPLVALYSALALSLWTKGFIGLVLVGAGLAVWCLLERRERPWIALKPLLGISMLLLASIALAGALYLSGGREAVYQWAWVNHVQRFLHPGVKGHERPFYYYLAVGLPLSVFPWFMPALDLLRPSFWNVDTRYRPLKRFCGSLLIAGLLVLTLSSSKRETYLLPLMAPLCLLTALTVIDRLAIGEAASSLRRRPGAVAWVNAIMIGLLGGVPAMALGIHTHAFRPATVFWLLLALLFAAGIVVFLKRGDFRRASVCAVFSTAVCCVSILVLLMPALDSEKSFVPFLSWIDTQLSPGQPVYVIGADETLRGIVPFTTGRNVVAIKPGQASPPRFLLCQVVNGEHVNPQVEKSYDLLRSEYIGPRRCLSLWQLKPS